MTKQYRLRIKKGDTVIVRNGKYRGKTGKVITTSSVNNTVTIEGINVVKKHQKPNKEYPQGGIVEITKPINVSKVGIYEPTLKKASRISYKVNADGKKSRVYTNSGKEIK